MAEFNFDELTREDGYKASSTVEEGVGRCTYQLKGADSDTAPTPDKIEAFCTFLCGSVDSIEPKVRKSSDENGGKILRRLPKLHPFMKSLSVAGVVEIKGEGNGEEADSVELAQVPSVTDKFWHYQRYNFVTEFRRRPYFLVPDVFIKRGKRKYYLQDGTETDIYYAEEWRRYITKLLQPLPDTAKATTGGQMRFRTDGTSLDGTQYPAQVFQFMENQVLEVNWFMVPYRYFFPYGSQKPYLTRFINTVNQNELLGFQPGELLWLGATPTPYLPQTTNQVQLFGIAITQSQSELCNVKMRWLVTTRTSEDTPAAGTKGTDNKNRIAAGHNLMPSFTDRKFHYVTTEDTSNPADETKWEPTFPSFPHELFFTDPLLEQPSGPI